jgi:hypothetical protein
VRNDNQYSDEETKERLRKILRGAFSGPPTPLKDIPKKRTPSRAKAASRKPKKSG